MARFVRQKVSGRLPLSRPDGRERLELKDDRRTCFCGGDRWLELPFETMTARVREVGGSVLAECRQCHVVVAKPFPTIEYDERFYTGKAALGGSAGGDDYLRDHLTRRLREVEALYPSQRLDLLEVGCSRGLFLKYAESRGHRTWGLEISEYAASIAAKQGLRVIVGDIATLCLRGTSIDFVHANHVLEHMHDPLVALRSIHTVLRPTGTLVIEVPNELRNVDYAINSRWRPRLAVRPTPTAHCYFFSPSSLKRLLSVAGFRVIRVSTPSRRIPRGIGRRVKYRIADALGLGHNIELWAAPVK